MDTLTKLQRSIRMSKIKSKDTTPELKVRKCLFEKNIRYRINNKNLPGKPDVSIMKYRLIIDVRGCFCMRMISVLTGIYRSPIQVFGGRNLKRIKSEIKRT